MAAAQGRRMLGGVLVAAMVLAAAAGDAVVEDGDGRHHVAGGDRGWDVATNMAKWAEDTIFMMGDNLWFTYYAGEEGVAEVSSEEEFDSCDLANPIRTYADGLSRVKLDQEGSRFFVGTRPDSCASGLKLRVEVRPRSYSADESFAFADPPSSPSAAAGASSAPWVAALLSLLLVGLLVRV